MILLTSAARRFAAIVCLSLILVCRPAEAAGATPAIEQYALPNGLTVVLAPIPGAQRVTVVTAYKVGSADEPKGRSGFAHLFEHLMFEGTKAIPDFDRVASAEGADTNAFTEWDNTVYHMTGPAQSLPQLLRLDADRMANLANAVTQEDLNNQRDVIRNEMRERTLDQPGSAARLQAQSVLMGAAHPYGHPTIGSIADLDAATLADVQAFHRIYYVPSNAVLAISGKFDPAVAKDLIARTFGLIPLLPAPSPATAGYEQQPAANLESTDGVETPEVTMNWISAKENTRDDEVASLLGYVLSSDAGPLYRKLVQDKALATGAACYADSRRLIGAFMCYAKASKGTDAEALKAALGEALAEVVAKGIPQDQLQAAATAINSYYDSATSDPASMGIALAQWTAATGDAKSWRRYADDAASITPEEAVKSLAGIIDGPAITAIVRPGPRNEKLPPVLADSTGAAEPLKAAPRDEVVIPEIADLASSKLTFPAPQSFTLKNGLKVNVYASADTSTSSAALVLPQGTTLATKDKKGLVELAVDIGSRGAGAMTMAELSLALDKVGTRSSGYASDHATVLLATAPNANFGKALELFALSLMKPKFDAVEWKTQVDRKALSLEQQLTDPSTVARRTASTAVYPAEVPEGEVLTADVVRKLDMKDAEALFNRLLQPEGARLEVVTSLGADTLKPQLETLFGTWAASGDRLPPTSHTAPDFQARTIKLPVKGATQSALLMEFAAPAAFTKEALATDVALQILGGGSSGRLYKALREDKGWSYGIYAGSSDGEKDGHNGMGYIETSVQTDRTTDSLAEINRVLQEVSSKPFTQEEFTSALQQIRGQYAAALETTDALMSATAGSVMAGYELADAQRKLELYDSVTLADAQAEAERIARQAKVTVIAGDPTKMK